MPDYLELEKMVDTLSMDEMNDVMDLIYKRRKWFYVKTMKPLTADECQLAVDGYWLDAIKLYRARTNSTLLEAKVATDSVRW